jgi:hypothetical protein
MSLPAEPYGSDVDADPSGVALADRFLDRCVAAGLHWNPLWDLDFIAGVAHRPEMFLVGRDLGADLTFDSVCASLETMADRVLAT